MARMYQVQPLPIRAPRGGAWSWRRVLEPSEPEFGRMQQRHERGEMAVRTWIGGIGNFDDPLAWDPTGVPRPGDTAVIQRLSFSTTPATSRLAWQVLDHVNIE